MGAGGENKEAVRVSAGFRSLKGIGLWLVRFEYAPLALPEQTSLESATHDRHIALPPSPHPCHVIRWLFFGGSMHIYILHTYVYIGIPMHLRTWILSKARALGFGSRGIRKPQTLSSYLCTRPGAQTPGRIQTVEAPHSTLYCCRVIPEP